MRELAESLGADFYGVADLAPAREAILSQGGALVEGLPRAISIGIALLHPIVDQLPRHPDPAVAVIYQHHAYDIVNQRLDHIASRLAGALQRQGHRALPVPASARVRDERLRGLFSHKLAAHLAGLGWIGKSCLLVTPQAGPRVRWATVLTDAPLGPTGEPLQERCGKCHECVDVCPVHAFTGRPFHEDEPREARYDAAKCDAYLSELGQRAQRGVCGLCLYVCPFGRKSARAGAGLALSAQGLREGA